MKVIVISDTHGTHANSYLEDAISKHMPKYVIHLGDRASDIDEVAQMHFNINFIRVKGNCDMFETAPEELVINLENIPALICHGHKYGVKMYYTKLVYSAMEKNVRVALFGHTHSPVIEKHDNLLLVNPGSLSATHTYAVLDIDNDKIDAQIERI